MKLLDINFGNATNTILDYNLYILDECKNVTESGWLSLLLRLRNEQTLTKLTINISKLSYF